MKKQGSKKLFTVAIVLLPILNSSHIGQSVFGFGDLFLVFAFIILLLQRRKSFKLKKKDSLFYIFLGYLGIISIVNCLSISNFELGSAINPYVRYVFYALIFMMYSDCFDAKFGIPFYINVCVAETIYGLIQYFTTIAFGAALPYVFPYLTMEYGSYGADYNATLLHTLQHVDRMRLVGFFPEASHYAEYTIFSIIFLLFAEKRSKADNVKLALISVGILLTVSSVGIIGYFVILLVYFFGNVEKARRRKIINRMALGVLGIGVVIIVGIRLNIFTFMVERISRIGERTYAVSGNIRLLRGFYVFDRAPMNIKLFGIGCGNYVNFINHYNITTFYDLVMDRTNEYMSTISLFLIRTGIIGTVLFLSYILRLFVRLEGVQKIILVLLIEFIITENVFFSPLFVLIMVLLRTNLNGLQLSRKTYAHKSQQVDFVIN